MASILNWFILAILALMHAGGLAAAPPALERRQQQWQAQRILDVDDDGYAQRDGGALSLHQQANVYRHHDAKPAQELLHQSQVARGQGVLALLCSPALGAAAGYEMAQSLPEHGDASIHRLYGNRPSDVYASAGAALGLVAGIGVLLNQRLEARELRAQAAESYNRQLLQDLNVWVQPAQGGAVMRLQKKF
jgi:hypothetical protein